MPYRNFKAPFTEEQRDFHVTALGNAFERADVARLRSLFNSQLLDEETARLCEGMIDVLTVEGSFTMRA